MGIGDTIAWRTVNRIQAGKIIGMHKYGYLVDTGKGKVVIVHGKSIRNEDERK